MYVLCLCQVFYSRFVQISFQERCCITKVWSHPLIYVHKSIKEPTTLCTSSSATLHFPTWESLGQSKRPRCSSTSSGVAIAFQAAISKWFLDTSSLTQHQHVLICVFKFSSWIILKFFLFCECKSCCNSATCNWLFEIFYLKQIISSH